MTGKGNNVSDLLNALRASTISSSLPNAADSLKHLRNLAYPDEFISPSIVRWMDQERRIFDVALGSAAPWLNAESSNADSILKAVQFAESPIIDMGQTRVTAALDVLGIDRSILDNP